MALENAKKFLERVEKDQALQDRLAGMTPEERSNVARELGLDYTEEELAEALRSVEIPLDELEQAAGGSIHGRKKLLPRETPCTKSPNLEHNWVLQGHEEEPHTFLFWDYTKGYDIYACSYCGEIKKSRT